MKKFIAAVLALCIVGGGYAETQGSIYSEILTASAADSEEVVKDMLTYCIYSDHAEVTKCNYKADGEIVILSEINDVPVTRICESAFLNCTGITKVTIPESITLIGDNAFENCTALTSVINGKSLKSIGICAFKDCKSLKEFSNALPITIGNVISGCTSLTSFAVADNGEPTVLQHLKFEGCTNLESIEIPESCILSNSFTLNGCTSIKKLSLPKNSQLTELTINGCDELSEIILPETFANETAAICIADCNKITELKLTFETMVNLSVENMPVLEKLLFNDVKKINYTISECAKLNNITRLLDCSSEIDYASCSSLKDIYYYEESVDKCHIPDIELIAQNDIKVHVRRSNTVLQDYLDSNNVAFSFIDDEIIMGDANCDGNVDIADAVLVKSYLINSNKYSISKQGLLNADVQGESNGLNAQDALAIQQLFLGLN